MYNLNYVIMNIRWKVALLTLLGFSASACCGTKKAAKRAEKRGEPIPEAKPEKTEEKGDKKGSSATRIHAFS